MESVRDSSEFSFFCNQQYRNASPAQRTMHPEDYAAHMAWVKARQALDQVRENLTGAVQESARRIRHDHILG